jgi:nucleoside-diphosphate-sugar epimerase
MSIKVLVTGAAGRLGSIVCQSLLTRGFDVRATDRRFSKEVPVRLELADLRDEMRIYALVEGVSAVVHLGNHPHLHAAPSAQQVLAENTTMNVNVVRAALDVGVKRIVFASSIQAFLHVGDWGQKRKRTIPFLPLDGTEPTNPGTNYYGLSKEYGERLLQVQAAADPELACTALRFPALVREEWLKWRPNPARWLSLDDALSHLMMADAGELVASVLERQKPGYHQYFPAQSLEVTGISVPDLVRRFYADLPLRRPVDEISDIVDRTRLTRDLDWTPAKRLSCTLAELEAEAERHP